MKREIKILIYANTLLWVFIVYYTFDLLTLIIDNTFQDALLDVDLNPTLEQQAMEIDKPQLIPKIIHQTYKTTDIPEQWKESRQKCIDLHPDYKYILWTDEMSHEFIREEYPWFLDTFENYKYPIQRADAIRYFILSHYGGVYIDLDDGCERRLDRLLTVPAFLRKTSPIGVSNDVMGSVPRHPFFLKVIKSLKHYDKSWFVPYMSIMASTGPLFISVVWKQYKRWGVPTNGVVRILQPADYKMHTYSFFSIAKGSSWHMDDAKFMKSLGNHILSCVVTGFVFAFFILYLEYCIYCLLCSGSSLGLGWVSTQLCSWSQCMFQKRNNYRYGNLIRYRGRAGRQGRLRKDSNLPYHNLVSDLEKNTDGFTDLSNGEY
ncbi:hypothetical protein NCAS_0B02330 [Naumovozyma castellii]|uniref:inositol phosphorylceramide mannosyltransferase n=1 Tax=Naumovozyma castellii TaxID=27288 RepID=G0VBJ1_NAUCA|nr:hypothetical protein NCAS_0B02330 [Naumovozyma castellii CBS 4309]CCC68317.1 hypothetical protein NCAS_0B02330 [Naumovozyma castellii CBS 4309]